MNCPHPAGVLTSNLPHERRCAGQNFSGSERIEGGAEGSHFKIFSTNAAQSGSTGAGLRLHPGAARSMNARVEMATASFTSADRSRGRRRG
jgi:hypothetical protein